MGGKNSKPDASKLIDGKAIAAAVRRDIKASSDELKAAHGTTPGLAVVLVGNRTDSATYVRMKKKAAAEVGFYSVDRNFDETVTQEQLLATVEELNADPRIHGARSPRERAIRHYVVRGGKSGGPVPQASSCSSLCRGTSTKPPSSSPSPSPRSQTTPLPPHTTISHISTYHTHWNYII